MPNTKNSEGQSTIGGGQSRKIKKIKLPELTSFTKIQGLNVKDATQYGLSSAALIDFEGLTSEERLSGFNEFLKGLPSMFGPRHIQHNLRYATRELTERLDPKSSFGALKLVINHLQHRSGPAGYLAFSDAIEILGSRISEHPAIEACGLVIGSIRPELPKEAQIALSHSAQNILGHQEEIRHTEGLTEVMGEILPQIKPTMDFEAQQNIAEVYSNLAELVKKPDEVLDTLLEKIPDDFLGKEDPKTKRPKKINLEAQKTLHQSARTLLEKMRKGEGRYDELESGIKTKFGPVNK